MNSTENRRDLDWAASGFCIGNIAVQNRVVLAPMSGVTDAPFRRLVSELGAGLVVSEMTASDALIEGNRNAALRIEGQGVGTHVVQLAGCEPHWMAEGAKIAEGAGADIIDINMGCPAKHVANKQSGSALMRDLDHALTLIEATVEAVDVPVTLKMRLGWDDTTINATKLARRAEAAGVQLITVHGRTRCQFYKGTADWDAISAVKSEISVPLIANGDCTGIESADAMLAASGADAVMIGRGAYGRPWLPGLVGHYLETGKIVSAPQGNALGELVIEHYEAILGLYGVLPGVRIARKHLGWYLDTSIEQGGLDMPAGLKKTMMTSNQPDEVVRIASDWFSSCNTRTAA